MKQDFLENNFLKKFYFPLKNILYILLSDDSLLVELLFFDEGTVFIALSTLVVRRQSTDTLGVESGEVLSNVLSKVLLLFEKFCCILRIDAHESGKSDQQLELSK